jgi:hypothetical protein
MLALTNWLMFASLAFLDPVLYQVTEPRLAPN